MKGHCHGAEMLLVSTGSCRATLTLQDGKSSGFQDNDSLAKELAKELNADLLVLLTDVDGLMDGPPKDRNSKSVTASSSPAADSCTLPQRVIVQSRDHTSTVRQRRAFRTVIFCYSLDYTLMSL